VPVEIIGYVFEKRESEHLELPPQPVIDVDYLDRITRAHEEGGFDRALVGYGSNIADGWGVASHMAATTDRLGILLAHRPGFVAPTLAARKAATLDHFSRGRLALHIISGGSDAEQARDGDFVPKDERYARTDEYLDILKLAWMSEGPFDFEGRYYRVSDASPAVRPFQQPRPPIYFGGSSAAALEVAAKHADTWALWGETVDEVRHQIVDMRARAAAYDGRRLGIGVSFRPILGPTEARAWERAYDILGGMRRIYGDQAGFARPENTGSQRLLDLAAKGEVAEQRLFTATAAATNASGNSISLVGTPDQVAEALLRYYDAGANTLLIRGWDPLEDSIEYGRDLLPIVRSEVERRDRQLAGVSPAGR
jgi:alkanesulfonate monooxygenase